MIKLKNKLAAGFGVASAVVIGAVLACTLPTKPTGPALNVAHASQARVDGDLAFVEISAAHYLSDLNPKGWGYPHYSSIETSGWANPELLKLVRAAGKAGDKKTILAMWEPSGQYDGLGETKCMAWMDATLARENWSEPMRLTWQRFLAEVRASGMQPMWYLGCAGHHLDTIVEDLAFAKSMGVQIIGLDAFSWVVHTEPAKAQAAIEAIRADPRTKDLTLITEGWLPTALQNGQPLEKAQRAFFLRHLVQLDLARGGAGKLAVMDENWDRMDGLKLDQKIIKGCRGIVLMHGSNWVSGDLEATYLRAASAGLYVADYRSKPRRSPRRARRFTERHRRRACVLNHESMPRSVLPSVALSVLRGERS